MELSEAALAAIKWDAQGLIPAIVQDARTRAVLMMAYMNAASLRRTLELEQAVFWSRRRQGTLAQRRHLRPYAARHRNPHRLRCRYAAALGRAGWARLPHFC